MRYPSQIAHHVFDTRVVMIRYANCYSRRRQLGACAIDGGIHYRESKSQKNADSVREVYEAEFHTKVRSSMNTPKETPKIFKYNGEY